VRRGGGLSVLLRSLLCAQLKHVYGFAWLSKQKWQVGISYAYLITIENTWSSHEMCGFLGRLSKQLLFKTKSLKDFFCGTVTRENDFYVGLPSPCLDITDQECWYWQCVVGSFRLNDSREWERVWFFYPCVKCYFPWFSTRLQLEPNTRWSSLSLQSCLCCKHGHQVAQSFATLDTFSVCMD
jgi:hypothetical protein